MKIFSIKEIHTKDIYGGATSLLCVSPYVAQPMIYMQCIFVFPSNIASLHIFNAILPSMFVYWYLA